MGIDVIAITNSEKHDCSTFNSHDPLLYNNRESSIADVTSQLPALFLIEKLAKTVSTMLNECP